LAVYVTFRTTKRISLLTELSAQLTKVDEASEMSRYFQLKYA